MISPETLKFLSELAENNHKDWFDENRKRYQVARQNFIDFITELIDGIADFDPSVSHLEPKKTLFRINRDIRFSKNKAPYKTNFGASITKGGKKTNSAGYYIHLEPGNHFFGGGIYHPASPELKKIRYFIEGNAPTLREAIATDEFQELFGNIQGDALKTAPKGFEKDHPDIDLIRMKDFYAMRNIKDDGIHTDAFLEEVLRSMKAVHPVITFINEALESDE